MPLMPFPTFARMSGPARGLLSLMLLGIAGCGELMVDPSANLPPCVDSTCNCGDFVSQELAQRVFDSYPNDPYDLDGDGNSLVCERLPATAPPLDRETYFSNSPHLVLGNPSRAGKENTDNYMIERDQYVLAYSQRYGRLLWASWVIDRAWMGSAERQNDFRPDGALPKNSYQVTPRDYTGSGYDRGHMVPSADRTATADDNSATFLMSNIFAQTPENNRGPWRELEEYARDLVYQQGKTVYVIGGVYGVRRPLEDNRVTPPSRVWKVMVLFDSDPAPEKVTRQTETIAVDMPNRSRLDSEWQTYLTSIDRIEIATGYDLLSDVKPDIQAAIEARR